MGRNQQSPAPQGKLVTSRKPDDIPAFDQAPFQELTQATAARGTA